LIEVNVLGQRANLYEKELSVEFVERLRGDHAFASADELAAQIALDVDRARVSLRRFGEGFDRWQSR
jgi:FAD synthase